MLGLAGTTLRGYVLNGHKWGTSTVTYYVNPQSQWVSSSAATTAVQTAASYWNQQANANISLVYGGTTSGTSLTLNNKNEVFFRNDSNGTTIAESYWWWDGSGNLIDADVVFHEAAYHFFTVSGCANGYYIEDIGVHEFGHVLGLGHSATVGATMYPYVPTTCDTTQESLDADDLSGIQALYPPNAAPNAPTSLSAAPATSAPSRPNRSAGPGRLSWLSSRLPRRSWPSGGRACAQPTSQPGAGPASSGPSPTGSSSASARRLPRCCC